MKFRRTNSGWSCNGCVGEFHIQVTDEGLFFCQLDPDLAIHWKFERMCNEDKLFDTFADAVDYCTQIDSEISVALGEDE